MTTLVDLYRRSVDGFVARVAQVGPDQWSGPTPCAEWDVRTLVNHIIFEERWSVPLFAGATIEEVGDRFDGDLLGADPAANAANAAQEALAALDDDALNRTVHLSFGDTPAMEYLQQLFADHLVHSWDLAVATGTDRGLDPEAVTASLAWFAGQAQMYRGAGVIGPPVSVPSDANDQDRLIAAFGRDPRQ